MVRNVLGAKKSGTFAAAFAMLASVYTGVPGAALLSAHADPASAASR